LEQVPVDWTISPSGTPTVSHTPNSGTSTPRAGDGLLGQRNPTDSVLSLVSVGDIVKEKLDYNLQKVSPFFTDVNHEYADMFEKMLAELNGKNSEDQMCIEEIIEKSEKDWFNRYRDVKLGKSPQPSPAPSVFRLKIHDDSRPPTPGLDALDVETTASQFLLPHDYVPPTGLKRFMLMKLGDWPVYSIILAIVSFTLTSFRTTTNINTNLKGQILAFNSYQITLLNGQIGQTAEKLYIVASIYLASSIVWWIVLRLVPAVYVLTVPFLVRYHSSSLFYRLPF
jgi:alpha-1,3-glucan synthase